MNREAFYAYLRSKEVGPFGTSLSQRQVDGIEALLDAGVASNLPIAHMANVLSQVHHETGGGMYPVKETVYPASKDKNPSDKTVIGRLDRAWGAGKLPWVSEPYWRDGWFGRGVIQLTHRDNYKRMSSVVGYDLVSNPELALDVPISAAIAVEGMRLGLFTGKKLSSYSSGGIFDHQGARAIVNGDRSKKHGSLTIGQKVEANAKKFESALLASNWMGLFSQEPAPEPQSPFAAMIAAFLAFLKGKSE